MAAHDTVWVEIERTYWRDGTEHKAGAVVPVPEYALDVEEWS